MWLVTAIGPVHGQQKFTFALEQRREYTVGRAPDSDIKFENKSVRPKEGVLIVGDWDPSKRQQPPQLRWKPEARKSKAQLSFTTLSPASQEAVGLHEKDNYAKDTINDVSGMIFSHDDSPGQGIELSEDCWFVTQWEDLNLQYDGMKNVPDETRSTLRRYCIAWTETFESLNLPSLVLSPAFKSNLDCNFAVCYAIQIVLPIYLEDLISNLLACWKKFADHSDIFQWPDVEDTKYAPSVDGSIKDAQRKDAAFWKPNSARRGLFENVTLLALKGKAMPSEKRYMIALGAGYQEIDAVSQPLKSPGDLTERLTVWCNELEEGDDHRQRIVWWNPDAKKLIDKTGGLKEMIQGPCHALGIPVTSGGLLWGSVRLASVEKYLAENGGVPLLSAEGPPPTQPQPATSLPAPPTQRSQLFPAATPASSLLERVDVVPSTYPEETNGKEENNQVDATSSNKVPSPAKEKTSPEAQPAKKPLKRRANRTQVMNLFDDDDDDLTPVPSQSMPPPPIGESHRETQIEISSFPPAPMSSYDPPSVLPRRAAGSLKRRANAPSQSILDLDISIDIPKETDPNSEARELYEELTNPNAPKRPRLESSSGSAYIDPSQTQPSFVPETQMSSSQMDIDGPSVGGTSSIIPSRQVRAISRTRNDDDRDLMPPPGQRQKSISEEPEEIEERIESRPPAESSSSRPKPKISSTNPTTKKTSTKPQLTKDENFLKVISKSKKASKLDEFDAEFNLLRIAKPGTRLGALPSSEVFKASENGRIDYGVVLSGMEEVRGNFIQIERRDLFRKDGGGKIAQRIEDGRPNFKKFKKKDIVRHEPIAMKLAAPAAIDAEMGEAYWPGEISKPRRQASNSYMPDTQANEEEDDEMPLLPKSRKRLLKAPAATQDFDTVTENSTLDHDEDGDIEILPPPKARRGARGRLASPAESVDGSVGRGATSPVVGTRRARAGSAISEVSSAAPPTGKKTSKPSSAQSKSRTTKATTTKKKELLVIDESEDDPMDEASASAVLKAIPKSGTRSSARSEAVTLDDDDAAGPVVKRKRGSGISASVRESETPAVPSTGRRWLVADDEEDFSVFKKKKRLG